MMTATEIGATLGQHRISKAEARCDAEQLKKMSQYIYGMRYLGFI